jgi:hypothetical protein
MIAEATGTDGRPIIRKTPSVTGSHQRPVPMQGAGLFSCAALLVQERMCKVASTGQEDKPGRPFCAIMRKVFGRSNAISGSTSKAS